MPDSSGPSRRAGVTLLAAGLLAFAWASWLLAGAAQPSPGQLLALIGAFGLAFALLCSGGIAWGHHREGNLPAGGPDGPRRP